MLHTPWKRRKERSNTRWKDACKRDMKEARLEVDNITNTEVYNKQSYWRPQTTGQARDNEDDEEEACPQSLGNFFHNIILMVIWEN